METIYHENTKLCDGTTRQTIERNNVTLTIEFRAQCVSLASDTGDWEDKSDKWLITLCTDNSKGAGHDQTFEYHTGIGHRKKGKPVTPCLVGVLYNLHSDSDASSQPFEDWCLNYDRDSDSRKALDTYLACQSIGIKLAKVLNHIGVTSDELAQFLEDY